MNGLPFFPSFPYCILTFWTILITYSDFISDQISSAILYSISFDHESVNLPFVIVFNVAVIAFAHSR